ncbi:MAG: cyclic nucleotide-binding domain-containing protein, partial [Burkholderiaceae bacterium]
KPLSEWRLDAADEPHVSPNATPDTQQQPTSDFAPGSLPPLYEEDAAVFSASGPRPTDPTAFPSASNTPPMDPQQLRPEDGGISLAYAAGDMLFSKGDPAEIFFVVTEGRVSLFEPSTHFEMAVLGPGSSLGEQSILMGGVHSLTARALDRVVCTTVRADRLRTILDQQPGVVKPVFEAILLQLSMHNELRSQGNSLPL